MMKTFQLVGLLLTIKTFQLADLLLMIKTFQLAGPLLMMTAHYLFERLTEIGGDCRSEDALSAIKRLMFEKE